MGVRLPAADTMSKKLTRAIVIATRGAIGFSTPNLIWWWLTGLEGDSGLLLLVLFPFSCALFICGMFLGRKVTRSNT